MCNKKISVFARIVAAIMVIVMIFPGVTDVSALEIVQPRASAYLDTYNAYVYVVGSGEIRVYFNAEGTGYMDELGVLSIQIYECDTNSSDINDWTWKKTFTHDSTAGMLSYDDDYHSGYVTYQGVANKYYKAYVCVWGGKNGNGDTRYFWTSAKKAI